MLRHPPIIHPYENTPKHPHLLAFTKTFWI
jgi:hypothetical protein